jgi:dephospho-CoA kinase
VLTGTVLMVGLTGGIGSGKSMAAHRLAQRGAVVIDADRLAREVVAPGTDGLREVVAAFGEELLGAGGALDRAALGARVFGDEAARHRLEGIIHPRVRARTRELTEAAAPDAVVVNDVPLLAEAGLAAAYHLVLTVETDEAVRVARLREHRGMSEADAYARIRAQATDGQRRAVADVVLVNESTADDLWAEVDRVWDERLVPFERNVRSRRPASRDVPVVAYDPTWPDQYARLAVRIAHAAGGGRVDHVGPTAVPGLPAPDVIDVQLTVDTPAGADLLADRLAEAGYPRLRDAVGGSPSAGAGPPAGPDPSGERTHGGADPGRAVCLHVRAAGSPAWRAALLVRDWLRADPPARREYAEVRAGERPRWTAEALSRAEQWARSTGWSPGQS